MATITSDIIAQHGLTHEEYERILDRLGRAPTFSDNLVEVTRVN